MTKHLYLIEPHSARFLKVQPDSLEMTYVNAQLGKVEFKNSRLEMPEGGINKFLVDASKHGYTEISEAEFDEKLLSCRTEIEKTTEEPLAVGERRVPWDELVASYQSFFRNNPAEYLEPSMQIFCVYDQPAHLHHDLQLKFDSLAPNIQSSSRNLIFKRGLTIDGNLDAGSGTTELPLLVIVEGDLNVKNLILSGWAEVIVTGNVVVEDTAFCFDGEAGGRLHVHGNLSARRVLGAMMYLLEVAGQIKGDVHWLDNDESPLFNSALVPDSLSKEQMTDFETHTPLVRECYYANSNWATGEEVQTFDFYPERVVAQIRNGMPVFR